MNHSHTCEPLSVEQEQVFTNLCISAAFLLYGWLLKQCGYDLHGLDGRMWQVSEGCKGYVPFWLFYSVWFLAFPSCSLVLFWNLCDSCVISQNYCQHFIHIFTTLLENCFPFRYTSLEWKYYFCNALECFSFCVNTKFGLSFHPFYHNLCNIFDW